ncbi:superinfection immunity protein [Kocuria sp.]|uniref:superinfection immunity protein n=1 Tax=Kocuria sp. TaxID=1871328 RepID=UPI0026DEE2F1|nr:superinfection immunity protein [Kocuria sp.]MDO5619423.1 superinfection immunity protein [Kocuria sp.]
MLFAQASNAEAAGAGVLVVILLLIGFVVGGLLYLLPSIIAFIRKAPNIGSIVVINVLLGWILVGWVVALAMAFSSRQEPQVIIQNGPYPGTPAQYPYSGNPPR